MILGYLGFYSWYATVHSYRYFKLHFLSFEGATSLPQMAVILLYAAAACWLV